MSEMATRTQKTGEAILLTSHRRGKEGRRKRTKMEKQLLDPLPVTCDHSSNEKGEEDDDDGSGDGEEDDGSGEEDGTPPSSCWSDAEKTKVVGGAQPTPLRVAIDTQGPTPQSGSLMDSDGAHCNDSMPAKVPRPPDQGRQPAMYIQLQRNPNIQVRVFGRVGEPRRGHQGIVEDKAFV